MATATTSSLRIHRRMRHSGARYVSRREFDSVRRDIRTIRSLLISVAGEDREGAYRLGFIRAMRVASAEHPTRKFRGAHHFLDELAGV